MRARLWEHASCDEGRVAALAHALDLPPIVARVLCLRGFEDPDAAGRFLEPRLDHLHDPLRLADMPKAVERILAAVDGRERIAIHGDYDVDGVTSTVILRRALEMLGGNVTHFIPERIRDGYGLHAPAVERLHAEGVRLVISVDCGIRSADAAGRARALGVDLIITDHHEPECQIPQALAVINPKRPDCPYPDKHLAGVGVAFKLVQAICARRDRTKWLPSFLKIAALGTLADVVPLVGENRVIAKLGLDGLSTGPHAVGLRMLLEAAGLGGRVIESHHVSFAIAPRVNAAGRMSTPDLATRLLLACDETLAIEARALAGQLNVENARRQDEEAAIVAAARKVIETDPDVGAHSVLVVAGEGWHRGVIGIVASKLVDAFNKPAIVLSLDGEVAHGSCRSIPAFDMLGALERCAELFDRFGGHRQAAGLTMSADRVREFRSRISAFADECLSPDDLRPRLRVEGVLPLASITPAVMDGLDRLAPHGMGNAKPVFCATALTVLSGPRRLKERHLGLSLRQDGRVFRAVAWRAAERFDFVSEHRGCVDVAFCLERNSWRGETSIELNVSDFRAPQTPVEAAPPPGAAEPATS
jgi:single-stranded-DNA-specific exonuclease